MSNINLVSSSLTEGMFRRITPESGQILLLFDKSAVEDISDQSIWTDPASASQESVRIFNTGDLYEIVAVAISTTSKNGLPNELALKTCTQIKISMREGIVGLTLDTSTRFVYSNFVAFSVDRTKDRYFIPKDQINMNVEKVGGFEPGEYRFTDYSCSLGDLENGSVTLIYPVVNSTYQNSDYNPALNNVTGSVLNSYTRNVEITREHLSSGSIHYSSVEKVTVPSELPDSFYTSIQNISGRIIGSKNGRLVDYTGNKGAFTAKTVQTYNINYNDVGSNIPYQSMEVDPPFFAVHSFSGSIFPAGTTNDAIASLTKSELEIEQLNYTTRGERKDRNGKFYTIDVPRLTLSSTTGSHVDLPRTHSILYRKDSPTERIASKRVYSTDLKSILDTDKYGIVIRIVPIALRG